MGAGGPLLCGYRTTASHLTWIYLVGFVAFELRRNEPPRRRYEQPFL